MTRTVAVIAAVVLVAAGGATAWLVATPRNATHASATVSVDTTAVVRTTLTTTTQLSGTLGYSGSFTATPQLQGTITALAPPGAVLRRGARAYEVDGASVYLFYGARPAWRPFAIGMTPGADVVELTQNLVALGYAAGLVDDGTFTWSTAQAVQDWQLATGQPATGRVDLGRIMFEPSALRVTADSVALGSPAQPGQPLLTATSTTPVITVPVPATQTYLVHRGDRVTVTVPSGASTTGRVVELSLVAATSAWPGSSSQGQPNTSNGPQLATVPALVALDAPAVAAGLDGAPVTVSITDKRVAGVLAVPITSLVALAGGGYAVWVDVAGARHLVAVTPGLFANTLVQVTTPRLHVGDLVEVPVQ